MNHSNDRNSQHEQATPVDRRELETSDRTLSASQHDAKATTQPFLSPAVADGGVGGYSGTGQAHPHHGRVRPGAPDAPQPPDVPAAIPTGSSYQSGGTHQDRAQVDEERKQREGGSGVAESPYGGADPAPGAPAVRDSSK